jgi:hypothetical protein
MKIVTPSASTKQTLSAAIQFSNENAIFQKYEQYLNHRHLIQWHDHSNKAQLSLVDGGDTIHLSHASDHPVSSANTIALYPALKEYGLMRTLVATGIQYHDGYYSLAPGASLVMSARCFPAEWEIKLGLPVPITAIRIDQKDGVIAAWI